jgi:hypothetical protein
MKSPFYNKKADVDILTSVDVLKMVEKSLTQESLKLYLASVPATLIIGSQTPNRQGLKNFKGRVKIIEDLTNDLQAMKKYIKKEYSDLSQEEKSKLALSRFNEKLNEYSNDKSSERKINQHIIHLDSTTALIGKLKDYISDFFHLKTSTCHFMKENKNIKA